MRAIVRQPAEQREAAVPARRWAEAVGGGGEMALRMRGGGGELAPAGWSAAQGPGARDEKGSVLEVERPRGGSGQANGVHPEPRMVILLKPTSAAVSRRRERCSGRRAAGFPSSGPWSQFPSVAGGG